MLAAWLVDWSSPPHIAFNALATILWLAALIDLARSPRQDGYNRRGAVLMVLAVAGLSLYIGGVFIPLGAVGWFGWWRRHGGLGLIPPSERGSRPTPWIGGQRKTP